MEQHDNLKLSLLHRVIQKQMAFMLGRHGMFLELNEDVEDYEDLTEIMSNVQLNSNFLALAREVSKAPDTQLSGFQIAGEMYQISFKILGQRRNV